MNSIIRNNLEIIRRLCTEFNVAKMSAFGSVCTDHFTKESDVDLLVSFKPMPFGEYADSYFGLAAQLEKALSRKVDLVTEKSLSNPYFIQSINETKELLYG